jgi:hypothetical protein
MRARRYVAVEPLHTIPDGPYVDQGDRESALSDALRDVELGAYDKQIMGWLVRHLDNPTMRTLVSLIERVRNAGAIGVLDLEAALQRRARGRPGRPAEPLPRTPDARFLDWYRDDGGRGEHMSVTGSGWAGGAGDPQR